MHPIEFSHSIQNPMHDEIDCQFAICETCFWSATVFKSVVKRTKNNNNNNNTTKNTSYTCPICSIGSISLISIVNNIRGIRC